MLERYCTEDVNAVADAFKRFRALRYEVTSTWAAMKEWIDAAAEGMSHYFASNEAFWKQMELHHRRKDRARTRSYRNQPARYTWGRGAYHPATYNRKRTKHGRVGVRR